MELIRMLPCRFVSSALICQDMNDHWSLNSLRLIKKAHHLAHIVSVHRSQICDPHVFKKHSRDDELLDAALGLAHRIYQCSSDTWYLLEIFGHIDLHSRVGFRCPECT